MTTTGAVPQYAFLGPEGTFAHAAALNLVQSLGLSSTVELVPYPTVTQAIDAVRGVDGRRLDGAVVPLENSVEGAVPATLDELATGEPLVILAETFLPVIFDLLVRPGTAAAAVRTVATHPHAEAQVRRQLYDLLPDITVAMVGSTALGARAVGNGEYDAAVAPPIAGSLYGLQVLAHDIADHAGAVTRFVLLGHPQPPPPPSGNDRTSLVTFLKADRSGALLQILTEFAVRGVNLTRIESRPTKGRLGHYCFSIDCEGHIADARVGAAVAALRRICADVRFLGSYPRQDGEQEPVPVEQSEAQFQAAEVWLESLRVNGA